MFHRCVKSASSRRPHPATRTQAANPTPDRLEANGPTGALAPQAARNLFFRHADQLAASLALVRDRSSHFGDAFDEIFRSRYTASTEPRADVCSRRPRDVGALRSLQGC